MRFLILAAYLATIPIANWMVGHVGTTCIENGPCLIPVWPGIMAPSGVLMIGIALLLRDMVQEKLGIGWSLAAIAFGVAASAVVAPPSIVVASAVAFALSELADLAVYTPLRRRSAFGAMLLSGVVGAVIDSAVFLWIAFGSLTFIEGQIIGKIGMTLVAVSLTAAFLRKREAA